MNPASIKIRSRLQRLRWWQWSLLATIAVLAFAPCDIYVARMCYKHPAPPWLFRACEIIADVGGGGGEAAIVFVLAVLISRTKLSRIPQLVAITLGGGLVVDLVKVVIFRARPYRNDLSVASFW